LIGKGGPGIGQAMPRLHMSKVAFNCAQLETLRRRQESRIRDGIVPIVTRFMPKRADELVGGSIYWIIKHRIAARQTILGFELRTSDRRTIIKLDPELVTVRALAKRAHQGWRYLEDKDAPTGDDDGSGLGALPPRLYGKLASLALV
jgi:hypothetical protein